MPGSFVQQKKTKKSSLFEEGIITYLEKNKQVDKYIRSNKNAHILASYKINIFKIITHQTLKKENNVIFSYSSI